MTSNGLAATENADRYIQQLVKHWGHRFATSYADGVGKVPFYDDAHATFTALADGIGIVLTTPDAAADARLRGVIETHLDRFAFREAPLAYHWEP